MADIQVTIEDAQPISVSVENAQPINVSLGEAVNNYLLPGPKGDTGEHDPERVKTAFRNSETAGTISDRSPASLRYRC